MVTSGEEDHRRGQGQLLAQVLAYRIAVLAGQHDIQQDQVVVMFTQQLPSETAVAGVIHAGTLLFKELEYALGKLAMIFHQQQRQVLQGLSHVDPLHVNGQIMTACQ